MSYLEPLMQQNFLEYASYVVVDRAIPDLRDGCKPVQRRILHTLFSMDDGKYHKVANVIGEAMKLHPHGDASIGSALVVLANKEYFIEKQGNYGSILTGHSAAAARYIECRLTPLARETLFNKALTQWQPSYDGRKNEPVFLPAKLPVVLMSGTEGIAVGMATKILPHNFCELLQGQIDILRQKKVTLYPDFLQGGIMDVSEYESGLGKVRVRAGLEADGDKRIVIREVPYGTTTESLIASVEQATQKGKVKISSINDFTTDKVEIELLLSRGVYADEVIQQLYAYTDCEVSVSSNVIVIDEKRPANIGVEEVLTQLTENLREQIRAELEYELGLLEDKQHWLTLEQIFIENKVYQRLEAVKTEDGLRKTVHKGLEPFSKLFIRDVTDDDIKRLLALPIRRISKFDIDKHRKDIDDIVQAIRSCRSKLRQLTKTTISYLNDILKRYGPMYRRKTAIESFESVDKRTVARQNLKVCYDKKSGFVGTTVKGKDKILSVSEYDLFLTISHDGVYAIRTIQDKILMSGKLLYFEVFDPEVGVEFTVVYRDAKKNVFAKKIHVHKFIRNKEYNLVKDEKGKIDLLLEGYVNAKLRLEFSQAGGKRKIRPEILTLEDLTPTGTTARGTRLSSKPVTKVTHMKR